MEVDSQTWSRFGIPEGLDTDADELCNTMGALSCEEAGLTMFSGATADDMATFTRQGGEMHGIQAPLAGLSRAAVNSLSRVSSPFQFALEPSIFEVFEWHTGEKRGASSRSWIKDCLISW